MSSDTYAIVMTSCADKDEGAKIADALLDANLAACVQMLPIESRYYWEGARRVSTETLLLIKCRRDNYADIEQTILRHHSYELPELLMTPIDAGYHKYLEWIGGEGIGGGSH
jgi:periplasmic divalent cation tolerance protein